MLESYFNKVAGLQAYNFIKKRLQHRCFPVNITKFLRIPILKNICQRLLLRFHFNYMPSLTHTLQWSLYNEYSINFPA